MDETLNPQQNPAIDGDGIDEQEGLEAPAVEAEVGGEEVDEKEEVEEEAVV